MSPWRPPIRLGLHARRTATADEVLDAWLHEAPSASRGEPDEPYTRRVTARDILAAPGGPGSRLRPTAIPPPAAATSAPRSPAAVHAPGEEQDVRGLHGPQVVANQRRRPPCAAAAPRPRRNRTGSPPRVTGFSGLRSIASTRLPGRTTRCISAVNADALAVDVVQHRSRRPDRRVVSAASGRRRPDRAQGFASAASATAPAERSTPAIDPNRPSRAASVNPTPHPTSRTSRRPGSPRPREARSTSSSAFTSVKNPTS